MRIRKRSSALLAVAVLAAVGALAYSAMSGRPAGTGVRARAPRHADADPAAQFLRMRSRFKSAEKPDTMPGSSARFLRDEDEVFGVVVNGRARAYPVFMLAWHHVVNDEIEGIPIAVTYCILCSAGIAFDPVVDGRRLTFAVDGAWQGTATLFDQETDSIWLQLSGECIQGEHKGTMLSQAATGRHTTWLDWRTVHPETEVMRPVPEKRTSSGEFGYFTRRGVRSGTNHLPPEVARTVETRDKRMAPNALVYGVELEGIARAYPFAGLHFRVIVEESLAGMPVTVWFDPVHRSVAGFHPFTRGRSLTFTIARGGVVQDRETGSTWTMDGHCTAGPLAGRHLTPLPGLMVEWYAWFAHYPETEVWAG